MMVKLMSGRGGLCPLLKIDPENMANLECFESVLNGRYPNKFTFKAQLHAKQQKKLCNESLITSRLFTLANRQARVVPLWQNILKYDATIPVFFETFCANFIVALYFINGDFKSSLGLCSSYQVFEFCK